MVTYNANLALYQPYAGGVIPARTRFADSFWRNTQTDADAWEVLYLSQSNPTLPTSPTAPSRTRLDQLTLAKNTAEQRLWDQWMDAYGCLDEVQFIDAKNDIIEALRLKLIEVDTRLP